MKITNNINKPASIFSEIERKNTTKSFNANMKKNKFDLFTKQSFGSKTDNSKLAMAGAAIGTAAVIGTLLCVGKKNGKVLQEKASNILKQNNKFKISDTTEKLLKVSQQPAITEQTAEVTVSKVRKQRPVPKSADEYLEKCIRNAKTLLIDDLKANYNTTTFGVAVYGPDSIGKRAVIDDLLHSIEEAGIYVEKIPRLDTTNSETIAKSKKEILRAICDAHKAAEARFKATKQNSVIVVNDMDKIALERSVYHNHDMIVSSLLEFEHAAKRGYSWLAIGESFQDVDGAVQRPGRIGHFMLCRPSFNDPKEVWQKYVEFLENFRREELKKLMIDDAVEKMKNLFG